MRRVRELIYRIKTLPLLERLGNSIHRGVYYNDHATSWKAKEVGGLFPSRARVLFPLALRLTQTHVERFSPLRKEPSVLQQQACEGDHSLLSTTENRNAWSHTATPLYIFFMVGCLIKG